MKTLLLLALLHAAAFAHTPLPSPVLIGGGTGSRSPSTPAYLLPQLNPKPSAMYLLQGGSGTSVTDASGNGNTGTATSSAIWTLNSATFDGTGANYISVPSSVCSGATAVQVFVYGTLQTKQVSPTALPIVMGSDGVYVGTNWTYKSSPAIGAGGSATTQVIDQISGVSSF